MYSLRSSFFVVAPPRSRSIMPAGQIHTRRRPSGNGQRAPRFCSMAWLRWGRLVIVIPVSVFALLPVAAVAVNPAQSTLALIERTMTQDQGAWVIDYRLRNLGPTGVIITSEELSAKVEGWVSNSRVPSHALPRRSLLVVSRSQELCAVSEVNAAIDESQRCRERLVVSIWAEDQGPSRSRPSARGGAGQKAGLPGNPVASQPATSVLLSLAPRATMRVQLRLEHQHILYGDYDPLLAVRTVELNVGSAVVLDVVPLDREQYLAQPQFTWPEPAEERRDTRHAVSSPDSLHLEADVPGHQYYRYPERPVRYNTKMRLRFWYLIAAGTEGECRVRVAQFKDTPTSWRMLHAGDFEQCLKTIGRWTKVERIVQTESEATTLTLEFKIIGESEVGEMWIDDVSLEPVGSIAPGGP